MDKIAVLYLKENKLSGLEKEAGERFLKQILNPKGSNDLAFLELEYESTLSKLYQVKDFSFFLVLQGIVYISYDSLKVLCSIAKKRKDISFIAPICNQTDIEMQRYAPPYLYQTLSVFKWLLKDIYAEFGDTLIETEELDNFCLFFRREVLNDLPAKLHLRDLYSFIKKKGFRFGVAKGIYVHRYGNVYESLREDLLSFVPLKASNILDIGCAKGLFGELLKKRQKCSVTGVDIDAENIKIASRRLDRVIYGDIENIIVENLLNSYDCIICGDILEHLKNPWAVVKGLKKHLRKGGLFIASIPNVNNWAIIYEMLQGRWDYVPFSILSGEHLRFFTKKTLKEMFVMEGYKIKDIILQTLPAPPKKNEFIKAIRDLLPSIDERELEASEIVIIASL